MPEKRFVPKTRRSGYRDAKLIIIAAEGEKTEKRYFDDLKANCSISKVHVEVLDRLNSGTDPENVMKALDDFRKQYSLRANYDELWMVIDLDRWEEKMLSKISAACDQKRYGYAVSNPCFELWLLLHLKSLDDYDQETRNKFKAKRKVREKRHPLKVELSKLLGSYNESNLDTSKFLGNVQTAIDRAKALDIHPEHRWPNDLGTRVYRIVEKILNSK